MIERIVELFKKAQSPWWDQKPTRENHYQGRLKRCGCQLQGDCERCGGVGVRRVCNQKDCQEFGCSFGFCGVSEADAADYLTERPFTSMERENA